MRNYRLSPYTSAGGAQANSSKNVVSSPLSSSPSYNMFYVFMFVLSVVFSSGVVNGGWSEWGSWTSTCSQPCGEGTHTRWRYCDTPTPSFNGTKCVGSNTEKKSCYLKHCSGLAISNLGESCSLFCHNRGLSRGSYIFPYFHVTMTSFQHFNTSCIS